MNFLRKLYFKTPIIRSRLILNRAALSTKITMVAEELNNRTLIRIKGQDAVPFLQGLITNDMTHLQRGALSMYTMFLNNSGRVLYDAIIYRTEDENVYLVECDKIICNELRRHLRLYRVRKEIEVDSIDKEYSPWVVFQSILKIGETIDEESVEKITPSFDVDFNSDDVIVCNDPRVKELGARIIMPKSFSYNELKKVFNEYNITESSSLKNYKYLRYGLGVGEGIIDHPPNKCFPLEGNCDFLHGVSFQKGCYVGQELTARVHHTGVVRKRLMPIKLTKEIEEGVTNVQTIGGSVVGTLRGYKNNVALALLRVEQVLKHQSLIIDGEPCKLIVPYWWPKELPSKQALKEKQSSSLN